VDDSVDLLERGFQLAHLLLADRQKALSTLSRALYKLDARHLREKKRTYWRDKYLKSWITRITRNDADILQWLILFESDSDEKEGEACGKPSTRDMIVRYIKHLVRLTTPMSSFNVNVGVSRLLHNYTGVEIQYFSRLRKWRRTIPWSHSSRRRVPPRQQISDKRGDARVHFVIGDAYRDIVALAAGEHGDTYANLPDYKPQAADARTKAIAEYRALNGTENGRWSAQCQFPERKNGEDKRRKR